jgi:predicted O-methyltransferase YrrM
VRMLLKRNFYRAVQWGREQKQRWSVAPEQEVIYRDLFVRLLAERGMKDEYFPVNSAANFSLLYLITRTVIELKVQRVIELGAGQSSILLDRLNHTCHPIDITTVEHDENWVSELQPRVSHKLTHVPLRERKVAGQNVNGYSFDTGSLPQDVDLIVVDGPPASPRTGRYSRLPALELLDLLRPDGGIIIIDDAERPGEAYLTSLFVQELSRRKLKIFRSRTNAAKRQEVIAYGTKSAAAFF